MIAFGYTSEHRDYIVDHIERVCSKAIDEALLSYSASEKPSREEIANKLASHALLDRSSREQNKIGFVNEFVLGHFVARIILNSVEWLNDDLRFLEPAVVSYQHRAVDTRINLWSKLKPSVVFLPISDQVDIALRLTGEVPFELINDEVHGLEISKTTLGGHLISNFQFNECVFKDCVFDVSNMADVNFLNCKYYGCALGASESKGQIHVLGAFGDQAFIDSLLASNSHALDDILPDRQLILERFILEKFWPVGREVVTHKHRPIKGVCVNSGEYQMSELYSAIVSLKKKNILREPKNPAFIEINLEEIQAIRDILGRVGTNGK